MSRIDAAARGRDAGETFEQRRASVVAGTRITLAVMAGAALYAVKRPAWEAKPVFVGTIALLGLITALLGAMPLERLVRSRHASRIFLAWNVVSILVVAAAVAIDSHPSSPLAAAFVIPVIFAGLAFPLRAMLVAAAVDVLAAILTLALLTPQDAATITFHAVTLVAAAYLCAWHARTRDRHVAALARLSRTDELTGTLNRRGFGDELAARLARHLRHDTAFGLVLLDLDDFKAVNDRHGHQAGDDLLQRVGDAIGDAVRGGDAVARLGGDEFAVLLDAADDDSAEAAAERVRRHVARHISASVGWASCPDEARDAETLLRRADERLYRDKGRRPAGEAARAGVGPRA